MRLFYSKKTTSPGLIGYTDAGYKSDPHKTRSQTSYVICYNGTTIFWRCTKQTLVATSTNHSEIISLYEARKECVWLRSVILHIQSICQMKLVNNSPTIIYEDNVACVHKLGEDILKEIRSIISRLNSFILMN